MHSITNPIIKATCKVRTHDHRKHFSSQIPGDGEEYINVVRVLVHPNYNNRTQDADYSILQVIIDNNRVIWE